ASAADSTTGSFTVSCSLMVSLISGVSLIIRSAVYWTLPAWAIYESAVVLRLLGYEGAAERWNRAVEAVQAEAAGEGRKAVWAAGNLLVVLCGLPDWQRAQEQVDVFLSACTSRHQIKEVLNDLADLRGALSVDASQLDPIVSRLEAALSQS
ncbi:hypothetical protein GTY41_19845, partial [Streptomyces sp. SID685]|uniref:hypothetical protein n=2 Tax=Streptomyces sp. SID685 TaxID=2690322 RepID=UPI00136D9C6D